MTDIDSARRRLVEAVAFLKDGRHDFAEARIIAAQMHLDYVSDQGCEGGQCGAGGPCPEHQGEFDREVARRREVAA